MAGQTPAQRKSLETKALAASSKSEGMRLLLTNGYSVAEVREIFEAPYGFVYGVARRAGLVTSTPRAPKAEAPKAKAAAKAAPRAKAAPAAKAKRAVKA